MNDRQRKSKPGRRCASWLRLLAGLILLVIAARSTPLSPAGIGQEKTAGPETASLTIEDCIIRAVRQNLGVAVKVYDSRRAESVVVRAWEKYLPVVTLDFGRQKENSPSYSWIDADETTVSSYNDYSGRFTQAIPLGGRLQVSLGAYQNETNARFQTINPRYGSTLSFTFTQPLLKDFGPKIGGREILIARVDRDLAESDLKTALLDIVRSVEDAYWELVYSIEALGVRRQSLKLAEDLLDKSQKEAVIGTMAPKEVISARAEVAARRAEIYEAESRVKDYVDILKNLLNMPDDTAPGDIVPADRPALEDRKVDVEEAFAAALRNRPDLEAAAILLKSRDLDLMYARNQSLPALNLNANYWSPGVSGDRILYLDDNPLTGVILGKVPGGASLAMKDALGFRYRNWSVSMSLDIPLSTVLTRAAAAEAQVARNQQSVRLKNTERQARLEVKTAVRAVETNTERVGAYRTARELAEEKLAAEEAKLQAGLTTNFMVLQYQRDLAQTRMLELRALIDYTLSLGRLDRAMGTSLDRRKIKLTDATEVVS
jgi:outer membrane protein TolC